MLKFYNHLVYNTNDTNIDKIMTQFSVNVENVAEVLSGKWDESTPSP